MAKGLVITAIQGLNKAFNSNQTFWSQLLQYLGFAQRYRDHLMPHAHNKAVFPAQPYESSPQ